MRVAGIPFPVRDKVADNQAAILEGIRQAKKCGADILLTPEGALSGYTHRFVQQEVETALAEVTAAAKESQVGLALGCCFQEADGGCYNQLRFYDKAGHYLGFHGKILRCCTPNHLTGGEQVHYRSSPLRNFLLEGRQVGGLLCNDLWANPEWTPVPDPHLTRRLAEMGVEMIFHGVNCSVSPSDLCGEAVMQYHEANLCLRARADHLYIITVNSLPKAGESSACCSGVLAPDGSWLLRLPPQESHFFWVELPDRQQGEENGG